MQGLMLVLVMVVLWLVRVAREHGVVCRLLKVVVPWFVKIRGRLLEMVELILVWLMLVLVLVLVLAVLWIC